MKPEKLNFNTTIMTFVVTAILTAVVVASVTYQAPPIAPLAKEVKEEINNDYILLIQEEDNTSNLVSVRGIVDKYEIPYSSGFSLEFPNEWSQIHVKKNNLRNSGPKITQYAEYIFTSEFGAPQGTVTITVSNPEFKTDPLVTQNNRKYITEDANYYYNYNGSNEFCNEPANTKLSICTPDEIIKSNRQIETIIKSFKILN